MSNCVKDCSNNTVVIAMINCHCYNPDDDCDSTTFICCISFHPNHGYILSHVQSAKPAAFFFNGMFMRMVNRQAYINTGGEQVAFANFPLSRTLFQTEHKKHSNNTATSNE